MNISDYGTAVRFSLLGLAAAPLLVAAIRAWVSVDRLHPGLVMGLSPLFSAATGWFFAGDPAQWAWWWLTMTGLGLAVIDLRCRRLPRPWVGAMAGGGLVVFAVVATTTGQMEPLVRVLVAPVLVAVVGVIWAKLFPGQVGTGDLTLYVALAPYWGWLGWTTVLTGVAAGVLLLGVVAAILWISGRRGWNSRIAAGPSLIAGGWIGIVLG